MGRLSHEQFEAFGSALKVNLDATSEAEQQVFAQRVYVLKHLAHDRPGEAATLPSEDPTGTSSAVGSLDTTAAGALGDAPPGQASAAHPIDSEYVPGALARSSTFLAWHKLIQGHAWLTQSMVELGQCSVHCRHFPPAASTVEQPCLVPSKHQYHYIWCSLLFSRHPPDCAHTLHSTPGPQTAPPPALRPCRSS